MPEIKPASEYFLGIISQKPMPQGEHSIIQSRLNMGINRIGNLQKLALALPELRCPFNNRSIVPDIAVFEWERIPRKDDGRIENRFLIPPDWIIEILSPEQAPNQVIEKILFYLNQGTKLGWFIDMDDRSIMVLENDKLPIIFKDDLRSISIPNMLGEWKIAAIDIFNWLQI
jgi:Uma2 family endonuclease